MSENLTVDDCGSDGASAILTNEKGRNKRKFMSDMSSDLPVDGTSLSLPEFPRYEIMDEISRNALNEEQDTEEFPQSDWDDPEVLQLEELLTDTLILNYNNAVTKIAECGYTVEVAEWAILHSSPFHCGTDAVLNVVNSSLAFLRRQTEFNTPKYPVFEGMMNLVVYTLLEMIHVLREVRPSMTVLEAMRCLLINELNLVNACVAEGGAVGGEIEKCKQSKPESSGTSQSKDSNDLGSLKQIMTDDEGCQLEAPDAAPCNRSTDKKSPRDSRTENSLISEAAKGKLAAASHADEKSRSGGKGLSMNSKREMSLKKAVQGEKGHKGSLSKGSFKAKAAAKGSSVQDKSLRSHSGSSRAATKAALTKLATSAGTTSNDHSNLLVQDPAVNSETRASVPDANCGSKGDVNVSDPLKTIDYYAAIPFDETLQKHVPRDHKDEAILMLVPHKQDIEKELQRWTNWVNEKVMQAARRLGKDKAELKMLRKEKEEVEKFKKDKQTLDNSTLKRLSEMESALTNSTGQIEVANCNIHRLEEENQMLKSDLETAKVLALKATSNLQSVLQTEREALKKLQSWDAEKRLLEEKLMNLRRETAALNNQLEKAKERQDQFKALLNQEEKEKLKVQTQIESLRSKLEEKAALMEVEAIKIKETAEKEKKKCEGNIKNLENVITEMKLESNKLKIAALNVGYGSCLPAFQGNFGVKAERECVMCMAREISVVFIPCSHQVLCSECNGLHEKGGMSDCPSCRAQIQRRVFVSYRAF